MKNIDLNKGLKKHKIKRENFKGKLNWKLILDIRQDPESADSLVQGHQTDEYVDHFDALSKLTSQLVQDSDGSIQVDEKQEKVELWIYHINFATKNNVSISAKK